MSRYIRHKFGPVRRYSHSNLDLIEAVMQTFQAGG